jgi:hypothetical protein
MWHVDGSHHSLITVGNGGIGPTHVAVTLFYNHGKSSYTIEQQLEPGEPILVAHNGRQSQTTIYSNSIGQMPDLLYAYAAGGSPKNFSASRNQSLTANGFGFTPTQQQSYTQTYATVSVQSVAG